MARWKVGVAALVVVIAAAIVACGGASVVPQTADDVVTIPLTAPSASSSAVAIVPEPAPTSPPRPKPARPSDLDGVTIRIVFTAARDEDARVVEERLTQHGAKVIMAPTSDQGNEPHLGKLYVESKRYGDRSELIVSLVADVEALVPESDSSSDDVDFNLWVARPPGSSP